MNRRKNSRRAAIRMPALHRTPVAAVRSRTRRIRTAAAHSQVAADSLAANRCQTRFPLLEKPQADSMPPVLGASGVAEAETAEWPVLPKPQGRFRPEVAWAGRPAADSRIQPRASPVAAPPAAGQPEPLAQRRLVCRNGHRTCLARQNHSSDRTPWDPPNSTTLLDRPCSRNKKKRAGPLPFPLSARKRGEEQVMLPLLPPGWAFCVWGAAAAWTPSAPSA